MARIDCWFRDDGSYITLPDEWCGVHQIRRQDAIEKLQAMDKAYPADIHNFVVGVSMLDDWNLPGMPANPEAWDVKKVPNAVMVWVWLMVDTSYRASFVVPKKKSEQSLSGQPKPETTKTGGSLVQNLSTPRPEGMNSPHGSNGANTEPTPDLAAV